MNDDAVDAILANLLRHVSETEPEGSISMTLSLPSGVVTGKLISATRWMREVAEMHKVDGEETPLSLFYADFAEEFANEDKNWSEASKYMENLPEDYQDAVRDQRPRLNYVHLREARFPFGAGIAPQAGGYWRGRASEVIGFTPGLLAYSAPEGARQV
ncbi:hypothetical protein ACWEOG_12170 [Amycolatopsis japonica]